MSICNIINSRSLITKKDGTHILTLTPNHGVSFIDYNRTMEHIAGYISANISGIKKIEVSSLDNTISIILNQDAIDNNLYWNGKDWTDRSGARLGKVIGKLFTYLENKGNLEMLKGVSFTNIENFTVNNKDKKSKGKVLNKVVTLIGKDKVKVIFTPEVDARKDSVIKEIGRCKKLYRNLKVTDDNELGFTISGWTKDNIPGYYLIWNNGNWEPDMFRITEHVQRNIEALIK